MKEHSMRPSENVRNDFFDKVDEIDGNIDALTRILMLDLMDLVEELELTARHEGEKEK